jgi:hypothetical protein
MLACLNTYKQWSAIILYYDHIATTIIACEQALKVNWEPALMAYNFEYMRLESGREILIGQML